VEQAILFSWVLDVGLKQQAVHLCRTPAQHETVSVLKQPTFYFLTLPSVLLAEI
jgi:hypothetical protein